MAIQNVGFIGLGTMGLPMALRILENGFPLSVYDLNLEPVAAMVAKGAVGCASPAEVAARSDAVCSIVPDSPDVEAVILGENGLLEGAKPETLLVEMSTIDPQVTRRIAERVNAAGMRMVDAPVCRSDAHAKRGELLILAGGSKADYEECLPLLRCMGNAFYHCGQVGMGLTMKLVNNMAAQGIALAVCEALTLSVKAGLDLGLAMEVMGGTAVSNQIMEAVYPAHALKGNFTPGFSLDWAHKDVGHALRVAARAGSPCPAASIVHTFQNIARAHGRGRWDHTALLTVFEDMAGVKLCGERPDCPEST